MPSWVRRTGGRQLPPRHDPLVLLYDTICKKHESMQNAESAPPRPTTAVNEVQLWTTMLSREGGGMLSSLLLWLFFFFDGELLLLQHTSTETQP